MDRLSTSKLVMIQFWVLIKRVTGCLIHTILRRALFSSPRGTVASILMPRDSSTTAARGYVGCG